MNRAAVAAAVGAGGVLALVAAFAGGYAIAHGHTVTRTRIITRTVPAPTVTRTRTRVVYRVRHPGKQPAPSASPSASSVTVAFGCKVLQTSPGQEEFNVRTTDGSTYCGLISVTFYDYAGSGDVFPPTSVQGATPPGSWQPVPAADIGASAEPTGCIASAG
jgi:hypothetical protein